MKESNKQKQVLTGIDFTSWVFQDGTKVKIKDFKNFPDTKVCRIINFIDKGFIFGDNEAIAKTWKNKLKAELKRRIKIQKTIKTRSYKSVC